MPQPLQRTQLALLVSAALVSLASTSAIAAPCPAASGGFITVNSTGTGTCTIGNAESLTVTSTGAIAPVQDTAYGIDMPVSTSAAGDVLIDSVGVNHSIVQVLNVSDTTDVTAVHLGGGTLNSFTNKGEITASGNVVNHATTGVDLTSSSITTNFLNAGLITSDAGTAIKASGASIGGDFHNQLGGTITHASNSFNLNSNVIQLDSTSISGSFINDGIIQDTNNTLVSTVEINGGTIGGHVSNTGTMQNMDLSTMNITGNVVNTGTAGVITLGSNTVADSLLNDTGGTLGQFIVNNSTATNGITNNAQITATDAFAYGIQLNQGTITANGITNSLLANITAERGIVLDNSSSVGGNISNVGTIDGNEGAINVKGGSTLAGNILNTGTALANDSAITVEDFGTVLHGSISNGVGAQITSSSGEGILVNTFVVMDGGITNSGTITATSSNGIRVRNGSTLGAGILNDATGFIHASTGIVVDGASTTITGNISNAGTITSANNSIDVTGTAHVTGNLSNTGTLTATGSNAAGFRVNGSHVDGNITNAGALSAAVGVDIEGTSVVAGQVSNSALMTVQGLGMIVGGGGVVGGGMVNSGTINAGFAGMIVATNSHLTGDLHNTGTVAAGGDGMVVAQLSTVTGNFVNGGSAAGNSEAAMLVQLSTITGNITNTGTLSSTTAGGIVVNQTSTVGGTITNAAGAHINAQVGINVDSSSVTGGIVNNGTVTAPEAILITTPTAPLNISNTGLLDGTVALANSTLNLNGGRVTGAISGVGSTVNVNAALTGESTISTGTLNISNGSSLSTHSNIAATSGVNNNGSLTTGGLVDAAIVGGSASVLNLESGTARVTGAISGAGTVNVDGDFSTENTIATGALHVANGATLALNHTLTTSSGVLNDGVINSQGLIDSAVNNGGGTLNLSGNTARVTGAITGDATSTLNINSGVFTSENSMSSANFNIAQGASLNARHALGGSTALTNSGTLDVRSGTPIALTGNYVQTASGIYSMQASSATQYGRLNVSGTVNLAPNANIFVDVSQGAVLGAHAILPGVITSTGLTATTFNVTDNSVLFDFIGVIDGNNVDLNVKGGQSVTEVAQGASNSPTYGVAGALDAIIASNPTGDMAHVIGQLGTLTSNDAVNKAITQMLPLAAGGTATATANTLNLTDRVIQAREEANRGLSAGDGYVDEREMWVKPFGSWAKQSGDFAVSGYDADSQGLIIGVDGGVSDKDRAGVAFTYAHTHVSGDSTDAPQSASINNYQFMAYGSHSLQPRTDISWQVDYGRNHTSGNRGIDFGDVIRTADSSYDGWNAHVGAGIGKTIAYNDHTNITPSIRADYRTVHNESYTETGADSLNLSVADQSANELIVSTDAKVFQAINDNLSWTANFGVGYDVLSKQAQVTSTFVGGGPAFVTYGLNPSPWWFRGGAGLVLHQGKGLEVTARYDGEGHDHFYNQTVSLKLRKSF